MSLREYVSDLLPGYLWNVHMNLTGDLGTFQVSWFERTRHQTDSSASTPPSGEMGKATANSRYARARRMKDDEMGMAGKEEENGEGGVSGLSLSVLATTSLAETSQEQPQPLNISSLTSNLAPSS